MIEIKVKESPEHFYLYCALLYNDNQTVRYSKQTQELKTLVVDILSKNSIRHILMDHHRYYYLRAVLNHKEEAQLQDYIKEISDLCRDSSGNRCYSLFG